MSDDRIGIATKLVNEYERVRWQYELFAERVKRFVEWKIDDYFKGSWWPYLHLTQARAKSPASLFKNLTEKTDRYRDAKNVPIPFDELRLENIGDLAAVRMIFYFSDDLVDFTENVRRAQVEEWFGARSKVWYDPRKPPTLKKHDAFGYASHHFPVFHTPNTTFSRIVAESPPRLPMDLACEVQLRTILQHAWAEGEHDIRYKGGELVNDYDRRQWGLVAALVECADDKLGQLKKNQRERASAPKRNESSPASREPYVSLHDPSSAEPVLIRDRTLFDVDSAMASVPQFKRSQLEQLNTRAPHLRWSHDSVVVRVASWERAGVRVQPCLFSDELVTNHVLALEMPLGTGTVRDSAVGVDGTWLPFARSPMANSLGVSCMVRTADGFWLIGGRSSTLSFDPGMWGCSTSGAMEWAELEDAHSLVEGGRHSIQREALEEIGLVLPSERVEYSGVAREPRRGGKPQMFFTAKVDATRRDFEGAFHVNASNEHDDIAFADDQEMQELTSCDRWRGRHVSAELREAAGRAITRYPTKTV